MVAKVFVSYRRDDSSGYAGRVHDRLEREFGANLLFMDVDAIPLGVNFIKVLREEVSKCDVLLAVIGSNWLGSRDEEGIRRLDNPNDFVRLEIATALHRDIPVIPILLDGAKIPKADQLPKDLKELALRNALDVRHTTFHTDMNKLIKELKGTPREVVDVPSVSDKKQPSQTIAESQKKAVLEGSVAGQKAQPNRVSPSRKVAIIFGCGMVVAAVAAAIVGAAVVKWPRVETSQPPPIASQPSSEAAQPSPLPVQSTQATQSEPSRATPNQAAPAIAQRAVLYEEDRGAPNSEGKRYVGSAIWRTEAVSPGPGLPPELAVHANIEIPERRMTVTWSLRRNTDKALPASHTIEIMFNLPADFPGGSIANVPGILMKKDEQARGTPLAGLTVKATNGFFLMGLSGVDADRQRNIQLLKDQAWFDIPIVYTNNGRAILAVEKGGPGETAFADAFASWDLASMTRSGR
jgi:hypothetical protein